MTNSQKNSEQQLNIQQQDIHIISQYSDVSEHTVRQILERDIYNDRQAWLKLFQWLVLGLGIGFLVSGIIFFFAYNWSDLPKFVKMGLIQALLIGTIAIVVLTPFHTQIKKIILIGSAGLVGVLFAVFGQIYQTGANAYDFFLAWSVFVMLWVIVSNSAALWLLFLVLINTTLVLYSQQVAQGWSFIQLMSLLLGINALALSLATWLSKYRKSYEIPGWFLNVLALTVALFATLGISVGIFERLDTDFVMLLLITFVLYVLALWHTFRIKSSFYLAVIPFSITVMISALLLDWLQSDEALLPVSIFIVVAVTLIIKNLIHFQKQWRVER